MQTLYIDVYFLINFSVDFLALYFSALLTKIKTNTIRLVISAVLGALNSVVILFLPQNPSFKLLVAALGLILCVFAITSCISFRRRIKFLISFVIFESLVGGCVSFLWNIFDNYLYDVLSNSKGASVNRRLLLFSVIVLILIGVFKMIVSFFSNIVSEGVAKLEIVCLNKSIECEAFVDSGNLAVDPMDMSPILFIKEEFALKFLPDKLINLCDPDLLERSVRKRIRLIPVSRGGVTRVLTGIKPDFVYLIKDDKRISLPLTLAVDKEKGNYGGYYALIPSGVISDAEL